MVDPPTGADVTHAGPVARPALRYVFVMATPADEAVSRVPFDQVLATAQARERERLRRYRRSWIVRHVAVVVVATALITVTAPGLFGADPDLVVWSAVGALLLGGWLGYLVTIGLTGVAVLAVPFAAARIIAVLRSDDLAAFERTHEPWWSDGLR